MTGQTPLQLVGDIWQIPWVTTAAVQLLVQMAKADAGLTAAAYVGSFSCAPSPTSCCRCFSRWWRVQQGAHCGRPAVSAQFQPTIKRVLLSVLGDLEAVWADSALRDTLLALPLPAMAALLSCNDLKVSGSASSLHICTAVLASAGFIDSTL
jgi:hypothetical protein